MTTTQPATIKAVDPALFNAFGVYVYNHQRNILATADQTRYKTSCTT
ncbi:hypothetical protein [Lacticaseibacillus sharpeae]|nr:hypothetical protein [Lacticaseibacillus sharpeae]